MRAILVLALLAACAGPRGHAKHPTPRVQQPGGRPMPCVYCVVPG